MSAFIVPAVFLGLALAVHGTRRSNPYDVELDGQPFGYPFKHKKSATALAGILKRTHPGKKISIRQFEAGRRSNPKRVIPPGMTVKKDSDFSYNGLYIVTYDGEVTRIRKDQNRDGWFDVDDTRGYYSAGYLGETMNEALAKIAKR